eukprot:gb/GECG01004667.1/.p1 GENE.gb/GECG01004667.1/~~gb/GECG01004667.1/.p1  ORF type:complete len:125 (+),score=13.64 gb/GECG01004667.1/:1-375(+)
MQCHRDVKKWIRGYKSQLFLPTCASILWKQQIQNLGYIPEDVKHIHHSLPAGSGTAENEEEDSDSSSDSSPTSGLKNISEAVSEEMAYFRHRERILDRWTLMFLETPSQASPLHGGKAVFTYPW